MIIMVSGLPGSGKTFFSRHLQKELTAHYLSTDMIREELGKKGDYDPQTKQLVYERMVEKAEKHLQQGMDVIVDATFHKSSRRDLFRRLALKMGHELVVIEIKASEQTVWQRLAKSRKHSEADYRVYQKIREESEPLSQPHLTLRSDVLSIEEMVTLAKKRIYGSATDTTTD